MTLEFKIELLDGRKIFLDEFLQIGTYSSHFDGTLTDDQRLYAWRARTVAPKKLWGDCAIHTVFSNPSNSLPRDLPPVLCAGKFVSFDIARDKERMASKLVIIWFEQAIEPHMTAQNVAAVRQIQWAALADDFDW